jgi:hypothetical protein
MTRGRENPACSITETGKRADSVRMLHSHHSPDSPPGPEAAGKSEAEEVRRNRGFVNASVREGYRTGLRSNPSFFFRQTKNLVEALRHRLRSKRADDRRVAVGVDRIPLDPHSILGQVIKTRCRFPLFHPQHSQQAGLTAEQMIIGMKPSIIGLG